MRHPIHSSFDTIWMQLHAASSHLEQIRAAKQELSQHGMWPTIPTEQWQNRQGKGQYLYMLFTQGYDGKYQGPDGKRKIYIGNKPERIAEARDKTERRRRYTELRRLEDSLDHWIQRHITLVTQMADHATDWPRDAQILQEITHDLNTRPPGDA